MCVILNVIYWLNNDHKMKKWKQLISYGLIYVWFLTACDPQLIISNEKLIICDFLEIPKRTLQFFLENRNYILPRYYCYLFYCTKLNVIKKNMLNSTNRNNIYCKIKLYLTVWRRWTRSRALYKDVEKLDHIHFFTNRKAEIHYGCN